MTQDEDHEVCPDCGYMRSPRAPCKCFKLAQGEDHEAVPSESERLRKFARGIFDTAAATRPADAQAALMSAANTIDRLVRQRDDWKHRAEMLQAEADTAHARVAELERFVHKAMAPERTRDGS